MNKLILATTFSLISTCTVYSLSDEEFFLTKKIISHSLEKALIEQTESKLKKQLHKKSIALSSAKQETKRIYNEHYRLNKAEKKLKKEVEYTLKGNQKAQQKIKALLNTSQPFIDNLLNSCKNKSLK